MLVDGRPEDHRTAACPEVTLLVCGYCVVACSVVPALAKSELRTRSKMVRSKRMNSVCTACPFATMVATMGFTVFYRMAFAPPSNRRSKLVGCSDTRPQLASASYPEGRRTDLVSALRGSS